MTTSTEPMLSRLDESNLDTVLDNLLANHPNAPIVAIAETGLFAPMPHSVPLTGQRVIEGHSSALELVVPSDAMVVIDAWTQARKTGAARATVHFIGDPEREVVLSYVDATHRHGVFIGVFEIESSSVALTATLKEAAVLRPKVGVMHLNELGFVKHVDEVSAQALGWSADELVGRRRLEFIDPADHANAIANWMDMLRAPGSKRRTRIRQRLRDGSWVWFEVTNHNLLNDPAHRYVLSESVDITEEMAAQEALRAREHLLRRLTETLPLGIFQIDTSRRVVYRNARLASILGTTKASTVDKLLSRVLQANRAELRAALDAVLLEARDVDLEVGVRRSTGDPRRCTLSLRSLTDDAGTVTGAIASVADVTESVRMRQELEHRATFDALTGCHNRASILQILERRVAAHAGNGVGTAAIFVDLDGFKAINDRLGHAAGDALLVEVAQRLSRAVRGADVVGRLGGDEFLIVCGQIHSTDEAMLVGQRVAEALADGSVELCGEQVVLKASIGVAWSAVENADSLVATADAAMYESKRQGFGRPILVYALQEAA